jgi:hypothetical protein
MALAGAVSTISARIAFIAAGKSIRNRHGRQARPRCGGVRRFRQ